MSDPQENKPPRTAKKRPVPTVESTPRPAGAAPLPQPLENAPPQPMPQPEKTAAPGENAPQGGAPRPAGAVPEAAAAPKAPKAGFVEQQKAIHQRKNGTKFNRFVFNMQRGVNDAAAREAVRGTGRLPVRVIYNALGQMFYRVGLQTEYLFIRSARNTLALGRLLAAAVLLLFRTLLFPLLLFLRTLWHDFAEPFTRVFTGFAHVLRAMWQARRDGRGMLRAGADYFAQGVRTYRRMILAAASYVLPVSAALVLAVTVWSVLGRDFSLQVEYNGQVIGFVENEGVWENAQALIRSRIKAADSTEEWSATPVFSIASVDTAARSTASKLADTVMEKTPDKVQSATGLYVDGALVGVCADTKATQKLLDDALAAGQAEMPDARAEFIHQVETVSGWYFTSSLISIDTLRQSAAENGWLGIKSVQTQTYEEEIPFETVEEENEKYYQGTTRVSQKGVNGSKSVTADVVYIQGVEVERRILSETVLVEAVPKIVQVGAKKVSGYAGSVGQIGSGVLSFPVPNYSYITTRFGQGGHRGVDICAPSGTPIYSCDGGTVVEAGYHYSWGNYIKIDHGNGMATLYAHCSQLLVGAGQAVGRGQAIALVGSTGQSSGNHCHLELYINGGLVNPLSYVTG